MKQEQKQRAKTGRDEEISGNVKDQRSHALTADIDAVLGEIDEVLEENAEEFVRSYVQKGGQ